VPEEGLEPTGIVITRRGAARRRARDLDSLSCNSVPKGDGDWSSSLSFPGTVILRRIAWLLSRGRSAWLIAALLALGAFLVPATAQASFTSPVYLSDTFQNAEEPQVALSGTGVGLGVWDRSDGTNTRVQIRSRASNGTLGSVQTLSAAGQNAFSPQVAFNPTGTGIIVWTRSDGTNDRIQAVTRSSTGVLGSVLTLSDPLRNAETAQVAIDGNGNAIVVWERFDGTNERIQEVQISSVGVVGPVQTLSPTGGDAFDPQVAVDGNGNALVVWSRFNSVQVVDKIQAVSVSAGGVVGTVQGLSAAPGDAEAPQVGVDSSGNAVVVWQHFDGSHERVQGRTRSSSGVLGTIKDLSVSGFDSFAPQVAVNPTGSGLVDWARFSSVCNCDRIQLVPFSSAGTVGTVQTISNTGADDEEPQIGIAANGNGVAVWSSFKASQENVFGRTRTAAGTLGSIQQLSTSGLAFSPQVAVNGNGNALADWTRTGTFDRIQAAAGP